MIEKCAVCDGKLQATQVIHRYWTFEDGVWNEVDDHTDEIRYYCERDHTQLVSDVRPLPVSVG